MTRLIFIILLLLSNLLFATAQQINNGLLLYLPFNANQNDESINGFPGTLVNSPSRVADRHGNVNGAFQFNGSNQLIRYGDILDSVFCATPNAKFSISGWFKVSVLPSTGLIGAIISKSAGGVGPYQWITYLASDGKLVAALCSTAMGPTDYVEKKSVNTLSVNIWHHFVMTFDGSLSNRTDRIQLYVNTIQSNLFTNIGLMGTTSINTGQEITVGAGHAAGNPATANNQYNGAVDDIRIYNRVLTLSEIQELAEFRRTYYSKSTGNLNSLSTWGTNTDGSGTAPLSFDSSNVTYRMVNNTSPTLGGNLRINGANSTLIFGDGTNAFNLVIGANDTLSCDSMFLQNNITLTNSGALLCTKLGADNSSNVQYIRSSPQLVAAGSYGNLVASSSTKTLTGNTTIKGTFGMLASINCNGFNLTLGSSATSTGLLNRSSGTIIGRFTRWFNNTTNIGATGLFPVGTATKYTPYQMEFTSAPTTGGSITCEFITGNPGNIGLPQFDFTAGAVFIDKAAIDGIWRLSGSAVTGGTFNATITANNFVGVNNYADLRLIRRAQAGSWILQGNATVNAGSNAAAIVGRIGLSAIYGEYGIGGDQSVNPLPVKLVAFTASLINNDRALLQWQTAQEFNADYFIVQRSTDQINWVDRGTIKAKGVSNNLVKYALNDAIEQSFDIIYYRLVEVDINGKKTGSKTISVTPGKTPEFSVFPNPAQRNVYVQGLVGEATVYNITGLPVLTIAKEGWVNIEHLKAGIYFVKSAQKTIKLVIE